MREPCGTSSNFWENYERDIELAKGLGSTAFRFSLEWSRIMPQANTIDEAAVVRYNSILSALER